MKEEWRELAFGEFAENITERVEPAEAETDIYVGLEHLDPECLHIKRWGTPADVTGTKLKFQKGDIIFGRRRAYQRKLAVAEFDGICSAHAMVVRAKPDLVLPEFLPFLMQSDRFMNRAVEISVGSLSPTINWKTLRGESFPVPTLDEQAHIAEILHAADAAILAHSDLYDKISQLLAALTDSFLRKGWPTTTVGDVLHSIQYGSSKRASLEPFDDALPILRIPNVVNEEINTSCLAWVCVDKDDVAKYSVHRGDMLVVRTNGNPDYVGRAALFTSNGGDFLYASYLIRLRCKDVILPEFLHAAWSSPRVRQQVRKDVRSSAGNYNLNTKGIKRQIIPLPPLDDQRAFLKDIEPAGQAVAIADAQTVQAAKVLAGLTNHFIGGAECSTN